MKINQLIVTLLLGSFIAIAGIAQAQQEPQNVYVVNNDQIQGSVFVTNPVEVYGSINEIKGTVHASIVNPVTVTGSVTTEPYNYSTNLELFDARSMGEPDKKTTRLGIIFGLEYTNNIGDQAFDLDEAHVMSIRITDLTGRDIPFQTIEEIQEGSSCSTSSDCLVGNHGNQNRYLGTYRIDTRNLNKRGSGLIVSVLLDGGFTASKVIKL